MSLTVSRGLTDAGRWAAVATAVAEHLDALERAAKRHLAPPPPPVGAIAAALRFFHYVLEGIALDQKPPNRKSASVSSSGKGAPRPAAMAGISNLSIAVSVMRSAQGPASTDDLGEIEQQITSLLRTLELLQENRLDLLGQRELSSLAKFLRELQRQGEIERDAIVASQERPRAYRGPIF